VCVHMLCVILVRIFFNLLIQRFNLIFYDSGVNVSFIDNVSFGL
jgi:hypothetical protein